MIIDRISYKKIFPIGSYLTEHIGLEASLEEKESPEEALNHLKIMVNQLHVETLTSIEEFRGTSTRTIEAEEKLNPLQASLDEIGKCTTLEELKSCWLMSKGNLTLSAAYKEKEKQLTNAK